MRPSPRHDGSSELLEDVVTAERQEDESRPRARVPTSARRSVDGWAKTERTSVAAERPRLSPHCLGISFFGLMNGFGTVTA